MAVIEGVGDEVLVCLAFSGLIGIILFAWASTRVRPLFSSGSVWMVHMQTAPERRVLEVYSLDDGSTIASRLAATAAEMDAVHFGSSPSNEEPSTENTTNTSSMTNDQAECTEHSSGPPVQQNDNEDNSTGNKPPTRENTTENAASGPSTSVSEGPEVQEQESPPNSPTATIKLKFLDDTQKLVAAWLSQTVGDFKRQHFENDVSQGKVVRLIYRGQLLRDDSRSLASYGLHENCVLHCHVSTSPYAQQTSGNAGGVNRSNAGSAAIGARGNGGETGLDLGRYIYVIFAFKFTALWSAWFVFPEYFSRTSLVSLILCSGLFMLFWYGSQRRRPAMESGGANSSSS